jgi:hypothetical protein
MRPNKKTPVVLQQGTHPPSTRLLAPVPALHDEGLPVVQGRVPAAEHPQRHHEADVGPPVPPQQTDRDAHGGAAEQEVHGQEHGLLEEGVGRAGQTLVPEQEPHLLARDAVVQRGVRPGLQVGAQGWGGEGRQRKRREQEAGGKSSSGEGRAGGGEGQSWHFVVTHNKPEPCPNQARMYPNPSILSPPRPYLVRRDTRCSCEPYGKMTECEGEKCCS